MADEQTLYEGSVNVGRVARRLLESASRQGMDVSEEVATALLSHATDLANMGRLPSPPTTRAVPALVKKHGFWAAVRIAEATEEPELLAALAKHSSAYVRRAVAGNPHTDQDAVEYLWRWACKKPDMAARSLLVPRVPFNHCVELLAQNRFWPHYPQRGTYPHKHIPYGPGICSDVCVVSQRLYPGSPDRSVTNLTAAICCGNPELALDAVALCAGGRFDGMSFADAVDLFEQHTHHQQYPQDMALPAECVRHALLHSDVPIDTELAGLILRYADELAEAEPFLSLASHPHGDYQSVPAWFPDMLPRPLPSEKLTGPAARLLLASDVPVVFRRFALSSAEPAEIHGLLNDRCVYTANWLLTDGHSTCDSVAANQALRLLQDRAQHPPHQALNLPADVVIDDALLARVVLTADQTGMSVTGRVESYMAGRFSQKPSRDVVTHMLRVADDPTASQVVPPRFCPASTLAVRLVECFDLWRHQPWAMDLIGALGAAFIDPNHGVSREHSDVVAEWLFAEFGDSVELWTGCMDLLESGFPGSLPELLDMVWAMFGDGLTRPVVVAPLHVPEPAEGTTDRDGPASPHTPPPGSFLAALLD